jgi:uncharacterized membrane protein
MIRSVLIGLVAGQRAMTPLAIVSGAARRGLLADTPEARLFANPIVASGAVALAAAEMAGDKMPSAPNRTVAVGLLARSITAFAAGSVLAEPGHRRAGGLLAMATAIASSHVGLALRLRAMRRYGQTATGFVEDALVTGAGLAIAGAARRGD